MNATVRDATPADAPTIAHVHWDGWCDAYAGVFPQAAFDEFSLSAREAVWRRVAEAIAAGDASQRLMVGGRDDGAIDGFASLGPFRVPAGEQAPAGEGELNAIYVLARAQRAGLGRALFECGARWLREQRGCTALRLWVIDGNAAAERFYRRQGGVRVETRSFDAHGRSLLEHCYRFVLKEMPA